MQQARKEFIKREFRISAIFILMVLSAKYLPALFSFSGKSKMYEEYYHESVPIGFLDLVLIFFALRLVYRIFIFFRRY